MNETRIQRVARAIVAMKTIRRTEEGFEIIAPTFRGNEVYAAQTITGGHCTCYRFETESDCEHLIASELLEREERAAQHDEPEAFAPASEFRLAAQQALMMKMIEDSVTAPSWLNAFAKAGTELTENKNIKFEGGVLTMISRGSGNRYIITKGGCSTNCKAENKPDYHKAMYLILSNLSQVQSTNVVTGNFGKPETVQAAEECLCRWNWEDRFYENMCDFHRAEMVEMESAAAYEYSFAA